MDNLLELLRKYNENDNTKIWKIVILENKKVHLETEDREIVKCFF